MKNIFVNYKKSGHHGSRGLVLVNVLVFAVIAIIVTTAMINWGATMIKHTRHLSAKEQAIQIAEAGIDYYRWHLAHYPTDYKDGTATTTNGPFIHEFKDKNGDVIGQFSLMITPPLIGSTLVRVESTGTVIDAPGISRTIRVTMAIPSFARYAVAANDYMRFGEGTEIFGPVHSNDGVRFDGLAHNVISSAKATVDDPDHDDSGAEKMEFGVHTHVGANANQYVPAEVSSNPVQDRPDVFMAGRQFPVPVIDFLGITTDLAEMKADAISGGRYFASSGAQGYRIVLNTDDTFDLYRVNTLRSAPSGCTNIANQSGWGTWSVNGQTKLFDNTPLPANGIIFFEDHVWVEGKIDTARVTIAAGRFPDNPNTWRNIIIGDVRGGTASNADLEYTNYNGQDTIALIAQGDIHTGLFSDNNLRVDAALMAQNGRIGRHYYEDDCDSGGTDWYERNEITLFGMLVTNGRYGFAYTDGTGYELRNIIYDGNLLYAPPPSFPLTSNQYTTLSWEEID